MQLVLPDIETRATVRLEGDPLMDDDRYYEFCMQNPDLRLEREATGEISIMPPTGGETGYRNSDIAAQLGLWTRRDGRGKAFDSSTEFILPNGAAYSPDASWVLQSRLQQLSKEQKRKFLRLCPDFVIELVSPSDRIPKLILRMDEWIDNGAQLGWLIDADRQTVRIFRPGSKPEERLGLTHLEGDAPIDGFRLELEDIWEGL